MPAGRPSKYDGIDLERVRMLASRGWTDVEMSDFFDVSEKTWNTWKGKHSEFLQSLKDWKIEADARVERSLYERATGYEHPDTKFATHEGQITDEREYTKHYPPDPTAAIFWLKNRQSGKWSDRKEFSGPGGGPIELASLSDVERAQRLASILPVLIGSAEEGS